MDMRTYPTAEDADDLTRLNAKVWQIEMLKKNPEYVYWGNFEDYMSKDNGGWDSCCQFQRWSEMFQLNDLNECVNFYFKVTRKSEDCKYCNQTGYNPASRQIGDDFYNFNNRGTRWCDNITQDEVEALQENHRLQVWVDGKWQKKEGLTAEEVNAANRMGSVGLHDYIHDAINRSILVRTRAQRLGVYGLCEYCEGHGYVHTEPEANLALQLWILHPRKGCSRGVYIEKILEEEVPSVLEFLKNAAQRNTERFSKL